MFTLAKIPTLRKVLIDKPINLSRSILSNGFFPSTSTTLLSSGRSNFLLEKAFASAKSSKGKSAKKAVKAKPKAAPAKKEPAKEKEREKLKVQKEKERLQAQREKEKEKLAKEKEKEKAQKQKEKERELKAKEKERLQKEKEKEKQKKKKDDNRPKRPAIPFTFYFKNAFPAIRKANPGKPVPELMKIATDKFAKLSDAEKKTYIDQAAADKKRYLAEMDAYNKNLPPKRPLSAYIIFGNEIRDSIKGDSVTEIAKVIAQKWKALSDNDKQKYSKLAEKAKADYQKKLDKWKATHPQEE